MNILLINPASPKGYHVMRSYSGGYGDMIKDEDSNDESLIKFPPIELMMFATALIKEGYNVFLKDYQIEKYEEESFLNFILTEKINVVILDISLPSLRHDAIIANNIKRLKEDIKVFLRTNIKQPIILKKMLSLSKADKVLFSDAVNDLSMIISDKTDVNTAYLFQDSLRLGEIKVIEDVDLYPIPARNLINHNEYSFPNFREIPSNNITTLHTSYGCPHPCGFYCPYPLAEGKKVRMNSVDRVISEFKSIQDQGINSVILRDPLFTFKKQRVIEICNKLISNDIKVNWWCETRIDRLNYDLLKLMKDSGCIGLEVGVETGDEFVMKKEGKRGLTLNKLWEFKQWADNLGLHVIYLFMFGLPSENRLSITKTIKLILEMNLDIDEFNLSFITPYPGTEFYNTAKENNWITKDYEQFSGYSVVMRTENLSESELQEVFELSKELTSILKQKSSKEFNEIKKNYLKKLDEWVYAASNS
ncbi:B12-binding domain-containing radical SAM protein [Virgibacillus pantothenticus]|uniref:B12-binding domain-containing radical SAM protein n=1 Tax=Virgibacillus pantothenticus TaxID=1473 RepID=UPI0009843183|nr:radical SAM protein [Virgibacillus pantothenticus]